MLLKGYNNPFGCDQLKNIMPEFVLGQNLQIIDTNPPEASLLNLFRPALFYLRDLRPLW